MEYSFFEVIFPLSERKPGSVARIAGKPDRSLARLWRKHRISLIQGQQILNVSTVVGAGESLVHLFRFENGHEDFPWELKVDPTVVTLPHHEHRLGLRPVERCW